MTTRERGRGWHFIGGYIPRRRRLVAAGVLACFIAVAPAAAVQPVFNPAGSSFYDMPFPFELRRDPDQTVSLAGFPFPAQPLITPYVTALEQVTGFGLNSGVFVKFDGNIAVSSLPADAAATVAPGASLFLINIDPKSKSRGQRTPLWFEFRSVGDDYRDNHLLAFMPVPGHPLEGGTLYAAVLTDGVLNQSDSQPVQAAPFITRMRSETPLDAFETAALPLYRQLWKQLEREEGMDRDDVVLATIFRTMRPVDAMLKLPKVIQKNYRETGRDVTFDAARSTGNYWVFTGLIRAPQFQTGVPPFIDTTTGFFVLDEKGRPLIQREEDLEFVLTIPKEKSDGTIRMPNAGWPVVHYMHGTGGSRNSVLNESVAAELAARGIAALGIDQPLHGIREGATEDGIGFYNPLNPYALRDNTRQAAADSLSVHQLLPKLKIDPALITAAPGSGFVTQTKVIKFSKKRRMFMGHSQGAGTGPLFLAVAKGVSGGVLSAASSHLVVNILTREEEFAPGSKLRDLVSLLLDSPLDLFHPALHLLQMGNEPAETLAYAHLLHTKRKGRPLNLLFTHGMLDGYVTTPMTAALAAAARYPLVAPTFPVISFPFLPGYDYMETFDLTGMSILATPVSGNLKAGKGTGGLVLFENQGHFPIFNHAPARTQYTDFLRSLAYDDAAVIPTRP